MTIKEASVLQMEDDYIEIELTSSCSSSSSSSFKIYSYSINSPQETREFEFQIISVSGETEATTSPADQLFYKGKLLPLHLPPRLQMVEKLLQNSKPNLGNTLDSSPVCPAKSQRVRSELNPDEYGFDWKTEETSWFQKLSKIKKSGLGQKLKASREYIKSLFRKTARSNEISAKKSTNQTIEIEEDEISNHRKSISEVIQRASHSSASSSASSSQSSSFSLSSNGFSDLQLLKRCGSSNSEVESSIEGAIAHCKQSHLKMEIEAETSLQSDSKVVKLCNEKESPSDRLCNQRSETR